MVQLARLEGASASVDTSQPRGRKNRLAMLCSKLEATKAVIADSGWV